MATIKVTGFIETEGLDPDFVDLEDFTGLTDNGYMEIVTRLVDAGLEDIEFERNGQKTVV